MPNDTPGTRRKRRRRRVARSLENPAVPLSLDSDEAYEVFGASKSASGVHVTPKRALGYPAVWRAVSLISGDLGKLPLVVYRQSGKNKEPETAHPSHRLVLRKPNDAMTAFIFKQTLQSHVLLYGNGYAYIDRDGAGVPLQLLILDPESVTPLRVAGVLWYVYQTPAGEYRKLTPDTVLHIKGLGFDGLQGYPVLRVMRDSLGAALAARDHSARYFKNGARPGGTLEHPGKITDQARARMRADWEKIHAGLENAHKVAILEEGTKYNGFASNARDAQLLETREFDSREIANIFGVPTHKLGDPSKVAYNSLGEENQSYYDDTLSRWLKVWSEECHDKLLTEEEKAGETHTIDFDYQEIQRANLPNQVDFAAKLFNGGIINQDEARGVFGFNPVPDGKGEKFYLPTTLVPADQAGQKAAQPVADPQAGRKLDGLKLVVADVAGRMARRLATHAEKAARSGPNDWLENGISEHSQVIAEAFGPVVAVCRDIGLSPLGAHAYATMLIAEFSAKSRAGHASPVTAAADFITKALFPE